MLGKPNTIQRVGSSNTKSVSDRIFTFSVKCETSVAVNYGRNVPVHSLRKYGQWLRWKMFQNYNPLETRAEAKARQRRKSRCDCNSRAMVFGGTKLI